MLFNGSIFVTTDLNVVRNNFTTSKVVVIGDNQPSNQELVTSVGGVLASVLLPPYQSMEAYLDNRKEDFINLYYAYLFSRETLALLAALVRAIMNGTNILIYINADEYNMYFEALYNFIAINFGIFIGTGTNQFGFSNNPIHIKFICDTLYLNEFLSIPELFALYPADADFLQEVVVKLINELNPYVADTSFEGYCNYFRNYRNQMLANNGSFLKPLVHKC